MSDLSKVHLVLFFTRGVGLKTWVDGGMFQREVALYLALRPHLAGITFVTHGDARDLDYAEALPGIRVIANTDGLSEAAYLKTLLGMGLAPDGAPLVFKSNQIWGADLAVQAAFHLNAPVLVRCGYMLSDFMIRQYGADSEDAARAVALERLLYSRCHGAVVTTHAMAEIARERGAKRVTVIPNFVDTRLFRPMPEVSKIPGRVCFVGRLVDQKNPFALIEAFRDSAAHLVMVGTGSLKIQLRRAIKKEGLPVTLAGKLPNEDLPRILNEAELFVLPSHYEGHPKTLLEAMACGCAVVAADRPGLSAEVKHLENGILCGTTSAEIRAAVEMLRADPVLRARLGENAASKARHDYGLERVVAMELSCYQSLFNGKEAPIKK